MTKILVVEDEVSIRENIQDMLEAEHFEVVTAADGASGLQAAKIDHPDLILCDIMMPTLDGYEVLALLRQNSITAAIPLIFLTAKADRASLRQGMELGADDYLSKPFTKDELLKAITARLAKHSADEQRYTMKTLRLCQSIAYAFPRELLAPLNDILGMAQLLIEDHGVLDPAAELEIAEMIYGSGKSLQQLAQNFLVYTNLELIFSNPEQVQAFRNTRNRTLTRSLITEVAQQKAIAIGRQNDLQLDVQDYIVNLAEHDLRKAVEEIIDNAFKFSQAGSAVRVIGCINSNHFNLYITDYGRGMTAERVAELGAYTQFERRAYEQKGCGLGLAVARRIVELYGGSLMIESIPQQQTIVRLSLPGKQLYTTANSAQLLLSFP